MEGRSYSEVSTGSNNPRGSTRSSAMVRASSAIRATIDTVGSKIEQGTLAGAILNTLCNIMGAGVLSMPFAVNNASAGIGIILLVIASICSAIAIWILVKGCEAVNRYTMSEVLANAIWAPMTRSEYRSHAAKSGGLNIPDVSSPGKEDDLAEFERTEASKASKRDKLQFFMTCLIFVYNFTTLIVYGRVIADSIPPVIADFLHGSGIWVNMYMWLILSGCIFFVLSCARNMEELKWTSLLGFVTIMYIVVVVVVRYFTNRDDPVVPQNKETRDIKWFDISIRSLSAITTYGLGWCFHYNVPFYYKELNGHTPKRFMIVTAVTHPIIALCYGAVGVLGYLTFGAEVGDKHAGGNIVNNYPKDDLVVNIGRLGLFFHFVSVYPILAVSCRRNLHRIVHRITKGNDKPAGESENLLAQSYNSDGLDEAANMNNLESNTSLKAIAAEAFSIVSLSVLAAAFIPGIGIVIEVSGCIFGIYLMFIVPGIVGLNVFSKKFLKASSETTFSENTQDAKYWYLALFQLCAGFVFMVCGVASLVVGFINGDD